MLAKNCWEIVFAILAKKNLKENDIRNVANFAKIAKVTRIFLVT